MSDEITKLFAKCGMKVREIKETKGCRIGFFKNNDYGQKYNKKS